ncbi:vacuolar ATPase assembly protein VMA12 [Petromyzon marinus]|uniref:Transmembrane protein 199 n=1 Tax=Petromyzon marinus TaxID=7757 RepID=A0AAJ7X6Y4_PETMA|nr:transmembrane protein 199 [Petromyzon marinus]XP_032823504.1 transmembrane protein 199 [Petromyzon marinus]XP_032823505.1 transmembrane protein 199 [Petromyzon marinus]XP_032823506.1 transmembrane protein 199 [Petromyzon marinus]XP_032823508.1 transmembrane protein 199 [Petromyzon marinus]
MATAVKMTARVRDAFSSALRDESLAGELRAELEAALREQDGAVPFTTLRHLHGASRSQQEPLYLHELLEGSELYFPEPEKPARNPELVARLEKLKAQQDNAEYRRMVRNVDCKRLNQYGSIEDIGKEMKSVKAMVVTMFNFLITVVAAYVCVYLASQYVLPNTTSRVLAGVIAASVVGLAELYALVKTVEGEMGNL